MPHPDAERLAALDHDAPSVEELAHLASCATCRAEREEYAALTAMAGAMAQQGSDASMPRLTRWDSLSSALRSEGLLTSSADITPTATPLVVRALDGSGTRIPRVAATADATSVVHGESRTAARSATRIAMPAWARSAAAVLLVAGSVVAGRMSAGASALPLVAQAALGDSAANSGMRQVLRQDNMGGGESFANVNDATAALAQAQRQYERASLWLASNDTTTRSSDVYRARLAALDQMMVASRAALRDAPQDPVLNHYYLAAYTAREATLQQLSGALPVDKTIESY